MLAVVMEFCFCEVGLETLEDYSLESLCNGVDECDRAEGGGKV